MVSMRNEFAFEDGGRCYACRIEERWAGRPESWWWFGVSNDATRHAPFRAIEGDTEESVEARVVAYYARRFGHRPWSRQRWESALWRQRWERALSHT